MARRKACKYSKWGKSMKNLILIGAGGHAKSCIDVIESQGEYNIVGLIDFKEKVGESLLDYPIIDCDENLPKHIIETNYFLITLGQIKSAQRRKEIYEYAKSFGAKFATVISPRAYVSKHAKIGEGTIIMHDALLNAGVEVGENCIINTKALLEHDVNVGDNCHISTASILNGDVKIGSDTFIGSNATVVQGIKVSEKEFIRAGSLIK